MAIEATRMVPIQEDQSMPEPPATYEQFHEWARLRDEIERTRLDFIWNDLDVCLTFASIVERHYKMGNREHAERTLASAEKGYCDLLRFFSRAEGLELEIEARFQSRFRELRKRLDGLRKLRLSND